MTKIPTNHFFFLIVLSLMFFSCGDEQQDSDVYDLVVYGGTSGGIAAAIQAKRMGKSVIMIEPSRADVNPGDLITRDNYQKIEGLVPDFILKWVQDGDLMIKVGELKYNPTDFLTPAFNLSISFRCDSH